VISCVHHHFISRGSCKSNQPGLFVRMSLIISFNVVLTDSLLE